MVDNDEKIIWNAHMQEYLVDGIETIEAFESFKRSLDEANQPDVVEALITGKGPELSKEIRVERKHLEHLLSAFEQYSSDPANQSIGKCLSLEGIGKGKRKALEQWRLAKRNTRAAVAVDILMGKGLTKSRAIKAAAEEFNLEIDTVRKALKKPDAEKLQRLIDKSKE